VKRQLDEWKLALVVPHAAILALLVAGMAQWVRFVWDRWQCNLLLCARFIGYESREFDCCELSLREKITANTGIFFGAEEISKKKFTLQF
jgi:hypothetical protein